MDRCDVAEHHRKLSLWRLKHWEEHASHHFRLYFYLEMNILSIWTGLLCWNPKDNTEITRVQQLRRPDTAKTSGAFCHLEEKVELHVTKSTDKQSTWITCSRIMYTGMRQSRGHLYFCMKLLTHNVWQVYELPLCFKLYTSVKLLLVMWAKHYIWFNIL